MMGKQVVRLQSGERLNIKGIREEIAPVEAQGVQVEVVPILGTTAT
jgi:precorrin-4 methylase